jgi:hypothetical protein
MTFGAAMVSGLKGALVSVAAFAVAASIGLVLATLAPIPFASRVSIAATFGALTALGLAWLLWKKKLEGRAAAVACLAPLGWLPVIVLMLGVMSEPIVTSHVRCGTGQMGAIVIGPFIAAFTLLLSTLVATLARMRAVDVVVRALTIVVWGYVTVITGIAVSHIARPDPDTYLESLPGQTLALGDSILLTDGERLTYERKVVPRDPTAAPLGKDAGNERGEVLCTLDGPTTFFARQEGCGRLTVQHDVPADIWFVRSEGMHASQASAFRGRQPEQIDVYPRDVAASLAPPIGWTFGGVLGSLIGLACLLRARKRTFDGVEGRLERDGWVKVDGAPPVHIPEAAGLAPGPIVVRLRKTDRGTTSYRDVDGANVLAWRAGTIEETLLALDARRAALFGLGLTATVLCATPLLLTAITWSR